MSKKRRANEDPEVIIKDEVIEIDDDIETAVMVCFTNISQMACPYFCANRHEIMKRLVLVRKLRRQS